MPIQQAFAHVLEGRISARNCTRGHREVPRDEATPARIGAFLAALEDAAVWTP